MGSRRCPDCDAVLIGTCCVICDYRAPAKPRVLPTEPPLPAPTPEQRERVKALLRGVAEKLSHPLSIRRRETPCGKCGGSRMLRRSRVAPGMWYVVCLRCGTATAKVPGEGEATAAWRRGEAAAPNPRYPWGRNPDDRARAHAEALMRRGIGDLQAWRVAEDLVADPAHRQGCAICSVGNGGEPTEGGRQ